MTTAAMLSVLPSIGVALDNGGTENRRGVAHAPLPEKTIYNCDTIIITGHRAGLDKNEARWVVQGARKNNIQKNILKIILLQPAYLIMKYGKHYFDFFHYIECLNMVYIFSIMDHKIW